MSDSTYNTVAGIIQYDVADKDVNGKAIREVVVRAIGSGKQVRVTVWDSHAAVPLAKGDFIVADGKASANATTKQDGTPVTYYNLSASTLVVVPQAAKVETNRVVNSSQQNPDADDLSNLF